MWNNWLKPANKSNFGISGERVENLLYRLENGALDYLKAKVNKRLLRSQSKS
jgi:hypothetical protein